VNSSPTVPPENGDEKRHSGPTRGEWQMLLVVATAFVLIVGGFFGCLFLLLHSGYRR
jgi:hypothetical protein